MTQKPSTCVFSYCAHLLFSSATLPDAALSFLVMSKMSTPFIPKQAVKIDESLFRELDNDITEFVANSLIANDLPAFRSDSIVHDNGCGSGAVTRGIIATDPPSGIQIHATDISSTLAAQATAGIDLSWSIKAESMDAQNLTFPDDMFSHSVTAFVFASVPDTVAASKEIRRTLKPGGTAAIAVWDDSPTNTALEQAHQKIRGYDTPVLPVISRLTYQQTHLDKALKEAGWNDVEYVKKEAWLSLGTDIKRWATLIWSLGGAPAGGWTQQDEDRWDETVGMIVAYVEGHEWHRVEEGVHKIRMVASVGIGRK